MINIEKYEGHTPAPWQSDSHLDEKTHSTILDGSENVIASGVSWCNDALIADAPLLLEEVKRLRYLCDTLFIYAHNIETGQSIIEKSNGEPLSTIDFEKDMTWLVTECKAGHLVGETGYEDCPDCGGDDE